MKRSNLPVFVLAHCTVVSGDFMYSSNQTHIIYMFFKTALFLRKICKFLTNSPITMCYKTNVEVYSPFFRLTVDQVLYRLSSLFLRWWSFTLDWRSAIRLGCAGISLVGVLFAKVFPVCPKYAKRFRYERNPGNDVICACGNKSCLGFVDVSCSSPCFIKTGFCSFVTFFLLISSLMKCDMKRQYSSCLPLL